MASKFHQFTLDCVTIQPSELIPDHHATPSQLWYRLRHSADLSL